jgi:predicted alpha/beta-fold hydrolase
MMENTQAELDHEVRNAPHNLSADDVRSLLAAAARIFEKKPFKPHPLFTSGHAQTLAAYTWPRRYAYRAQHREYRERLFEVEKDVRLLAHYRWQANDPRAYPTILLVHGLEGSSSSIYMLGTADKAFRAGFNVVRLNLRNCGDTEHLTPTLYNSGLARDLRAVVKELIEEDRLPEIFLVGFSMSGNMALKLGGEEGELVPRELAAICAVSPSIDLSSCAEAIERRANWVYQKSFIRSLHGRIRRKKQLYPDLYDTSDLHLVRTIRDFDERYTAVDGGYENADDYYRRASALPLIRDIRIPTLIIHAQDDPFIPFQPLRDPSIAANPYVLLNAPLNGGHVGFVAADAVDGEDRFWAENRIVEFCQLVHEQSNH